MHQGPVPGAARPPGVTYAAFLGTSFATRGLSSTPEGDHLRDRGELSELFFLNLSQTTGPGVAVTVAAFLDRLADLEKNDGSFGENGPAARELLAQRGLTPDKVKAAQVRVDQLGSFVADTPQDTSVEDPKAAEDKLWAWYLEWSGIARVAVRDGRLLRTLGFSRKRSSGDPAPAATVATPTLAPWGATGSRAVRGCGAPRGDVGAIRRVTSGGGGRAGLARGWRSPLGIMDPSSAMTLDDSVPPAVSLRDDTLINADAQRAWEGAGPWPARTVWE